MSSWSSGSGQPLGGAEILAAYLIVCAAVGAWLTRTRRSALGAAGPPDAPGVFPDDPYLTALLAGGSRRLFLTVLVGLDAGAGSGYDGETVALGATVDSRRCRSLFRAVVVACSEMQPATGRPDPSIELRTAADALQVELIDRGWVIRPERRARARRWSWVLVLVGSFGGVRAITHPFDDPRVILSAVATVAVGWGVRSLLTVRSRTRLGDRVLARLRSGHRDLDPAMPGPRVSAAPESTVMGAALFGADWAPESAVTMSAVLADRAGRAGVTTFGSNGAGFISGA